jgi:hypothetical protein
MATDTDTETAFRFHLAELEPEVSAIRATEHPAFFPSNSFERAIAKTEFTEFKIHAWQISEESKKPL